MMTRLTAPGALDLGDRQMVELPDTTGLQLRCDSGSLWITLDHDPRDIVLEAGQSFSGGMPRRAIVYALEASRLTVATASAQARTPTQRQGQAHGQHPQGIRSPAHA